MSHQGNGLSLFNGQVDVLQDPLGIILERYVLELDLLLQRTDVYRVGNLWHLVFGHENLVYTLHAGQTLWNGIAGFGEFLQRIDEAIKHHQVEDEGRSCDGAVVIQNQGASKPQDNHNQYGTQEFTHRVSHLLAGIYSVDGFSVLVVGVCKSLVHLVLGIERLDDAQSAQSFFQLCHEVTPLVLCHQRFAFQHSAYSSHNPTHEREYGNGEEGQFPAGRNQGTEVEDNQYRILEEHVQRSHDAVFYFVHVTTHAGHDVTLALFGEEAQWQRQDLVVEGNADIAYHPCTDRDDGSRRKEIAGSLQESHECQEHTQQEEGRAGSMCLNQLGHIIIEIIDGNILERAFRSPWNKGIVGLLHLEQDLQDGDNEHEREDVQNGRKDIEDNVQNQEFFVRRYKASEYLDKFFHVSVD